MADEDDHNCSENQGKERGNIMGKKEATLFNSRIESNKRNGVDNTVNQSLHRLTIRWKKNVFDRVHCSCYGNEYRRQQQHIH